MPNEKLCGDSVCSSKNMDRKILYTRRAVSPAINPLNRSDNNSRRTRTAPFTPFRWGIAPSADYY